MIRTESRSDARSLTSRPAPGASRIAAVPLVLGVVFLALTRALAASPPAARKPAVNVILITIDTVRANHLGCYGAKEDRKSTRLNSSHQIISYAVFCLKKKKYRMCGFL